MAAREVDVHKRLGIEPISSLKRRTNVLWSNDTIIQFSLQVQFSIQNVLHEQVHGPSGRTL